MADISLEDIIKEAKKRKIDLGEDPEKTIKLSARLGLIQNPKDRDRLRMASQRQPSYSLKER